MKYCGEQGCTQLISKGFYCPDHRRRRKKPKPYKHDNKSLYNSGVWKRLTAFIYYERERGLCQRCGKFVFGKDAHNHHVIPVAVDPKLKLDPDNIRLLCGKCHVVEEQELRDKDVPDYFK